MKLFRYISIVLILFTAMACDKEIVTEDYPIDLFFKLVVKNDISVRLVQDSANYIKLIGPEEVVRNVIIQTKGDTIVLSNSTVLGYYPEEIWAEIHFTDFKSMLLRNGGDVINDDTLRFSYFSIGSNKAMGNVSLRMTTTNLSLGISTGSVSIDISGSCKKLSVWTTAPGFIDLQQMKAESVSCINNSSNDCYVWATRELNATPGYLGKIYYRGGPGSLLVPEGMEDAVISLD